MSASRAPNGSSISITSGSLASARAIWQRCCMPPDSSYGALLGEVGEADPLELGERSGAAVGLAHAAQARAELDVAAHRQPRVQRRRVLEHDAPLGPGSGDRGAADRDRRRRSGVTKPASSCSSVVLPQPLGPTTDTNSPAATSRSMPASAVTVPPPLTGSGARRRATRNARPGRRRPGDRGRPRGSVSSGRRRRRTPG